MRIAYCQKATYRMTLMFDETERTTLLRVLDEGMRRTSLSDDDRHTVHTLYMTIGRQAMMCEHGDTTVDTGTGA